MTHGSMFLSIARLALPFVFAAPMAHAAREWTPREYYNRGAESLEKGYLREAENYLLEATRSNVEAIQPPALYDLGHVRFRQGTDLLKGEQPRLPMLENAETTNEDGEAAIAESDRALKSEQLDRILSAYLAGRSTRKALRHADEDVRRALDLYGAVLVRWRRSAGDFRSTVELRPGDKDAGFNAEVVQRHIEELLKHIEQLQQMQAQVGESRKELQEKLEELRGKIPDGLLQPGQGGDEDEDEPAPDPDSGFKDEAGPDGKPRGITPEMAQQILEALRLNGDRKLPAGGDEIEERKPRDRRGRDW